VKGWLSDVATVIVMLAGISTLAKNVLDIKDRNKKKNRQKKRKKKRK
jgi:hypothetical protein